jgi:hypothetical protein
MVGDRIFGEENTPPAFLFQAGSESGLRFGRLTSGELSRRKSSPPVCRPLETLESAVQRLNDLIHAFDDAILLVKYSLAGWFHRLHPLFA